MSNNETSLIYRFNSADDAIEWLSFYMYNKREKILSTVITNLHNECKKLRLEIEQI